MLSPLLIVYIEKYCWIFLWCDMLDERERKGECGGQSERELVEREGEREGAREGWRGWERDRETAVGR